MELRHLRYFLAVAEELNFTRAAEKLRLAQPSLTRQIQNLEEELGVRLLERTKSQVSLTEEGRSFLIDARRLVEQSLESMEAVLRVSQGKTSQLNLGYLSKFNFDLLPGTLLEFARRRPETSVNLFDMVPAKQLHALQARKIDLGFIGVRPPAPRKDLEHLVWECTSRHELVVVLPAKHPLVKKSKINLRDLEPLFFVSMSEVTHPGSNAWLRSVCQEHANFKPRVLQDVELESDLLFFVAEGLGVTLARKQIKNLAHPGVAFRPPARPILAEYWIAWHEENRSEALLQYIEIVKQEAPGLASKNKR
jgi:DNA-binding transcriptional LysR family regulator